MRHTLTALSLLLLASSAVAQQGYSAKSLFFGEDDSVISASTGLTPSPPAGQAKADPVAKAESIIKAEPVAKAEPMTKANPVAKTESMAKIEPMEKTELLTKTEPAAKKAVSVAAYKKPAAKKQIGASYFVRLKNADGSSRDVLVSRKFKSGERFQLGVKVSSPGYVYILNQEPDGKIVQIYPQPGRDNFINAMGTVFLPSQGSFEFDNKPGIEQLLVYLSPMQIDDKISARVRESSPDMISTFVDVASVSAACAPVQMAKTTAPSEWRTVETIDDEPRYASKGISFSDDATAACDSEATKSSAAYASKGISFSDDAEPANGGQVASYVVKNTGAQTDKSLYLKLKLVHE